MISIMIEHVPVAELPSLNLPPLTDDEAKDALQESRREACDAQLAASRSLRPAR